LHTASAFQFEQQFVVMSQDRITAQHFAYCTKFFCSLRYEFRFKHYLETMHSCTPNSKLTQDTVGKSKPNSN